MGITQLELDGAFEEYHTRFGGVKEDYFALLYLSKEFGKTPDELYVQVAFGGNDYGIDAFHIDRERRNLYLYQFKWSKDHNLFRDSFQRLISDGMDRVFGNPLQDKQQNDVLISLKSQLNEDQSIIDRVLVLFVFNGDPAAAEHSAVLDNLREELESKKFLIDQYFGRKGINLTFEYRSNETRKLSVAAHSRKTYEYEIPLQGAIPFETSDGQQKMLVGFTRLMDLYGMYKEMGQRFFERNIRYGLSPDKPPNKSMRTALADIVLQEKQDPTVFTFNHNGVTLAAQQVEVSEGDSQMKIVEPRLLNGAQSITSFNKFLQDNERNPALKKGEAKLSSIMVLTKIVQGSPEFVTDVTVYNNKQNKVDAWSLRANDLIQLSFQDKFSKDLGIYYERQEDAFENLTDADLEEMGIEQYKAIELKRLGHTFLAIQGEIDRMSRIGEVFENRKLYEETFRESYLSANSKKIILAYKIQFRLGRILNEILERGPAKYGYIMNEKNLVWALLIQGMFNQEDLSNLAEQFGTTLTVEKDYTDRLNELASKRVRFLIGEIVASRDYEDQVQKGKFSFLRTKTAFQRCMDVAYRRFRWTKRSI